MVRQASYTLVYHRLVNHVAKQYRKMHGLITAATTTPGGTLSYAHSGDLFT